MESERGFFFFSDSKLKAGEREKEKTRRRKEGKEGKEKEKEKKKGDWFDNLYAPDPGIHAFNYYTLLRLSLQKSPKTFTTGLKPERNYFESVAGTLWLAVGEEQYECGLLGTSLQYLGWGHNRGAEASFSRRNPQLLTWNLAKGIFCHKLLSKAMPRSSVVPS